MKRTTRKRTEETKQKISEALKGKPKTEKHKEAISIALKNIGQVYPMTIITIILIDMK